MVVGIVGYCWVLLAVVRDCWLLFAIVGYQREVVTAAGSISEGGEEEEEMIILISSSISTMRGASKGYRTSQGNKRT